MSFFPAKDPAAGDAKAADAIDLIVVPRSVDVGHFAVRRALPHAKRRMVGPFIFFDHFGPAEFRAGQGIDVRPHPHIGLATVTFLFDGEIMHRDSLGTAAAIRPGEVNWMTAGRGIVHSERTAPDHRNDGEPIHGLQCWVALPAADEETAPAFAHHDSAALPLVSAEGKTVRVIAGNVYGERSPVATRSETLFADVTLAAGTALPVDAETEERAVYLIAGEVDIAGDRFSRRPPARASSRRCDHGDGRGRHTPRAPRRCGHGRAASHLVEFRLVAQGAHRAGQGGLEACSLRHRAG